jgi:hypothetical protein
MLDFELERRLPTWTGQEFTILSAGSFLSFDAASDTTNTGKALTGLLSAYGIVWDLSEEGTLERVLPTPVQTFVHSAFDELNDTRFVGAATVLKEAISAYDDRPRRDREVCVSVYNALESTAKVVLSKPNSTFGGVLNVCKEKLFFDSYTFDILHQVECLRHNRFGHGMTTEFGLKPAEVDFFYLTCIAGILLFARLRPA